MKHKITQIEMKQFEKYLREEEKSKGTIEKYMRDVETLRSYIGEKEYVSKEVMIQYKQHLLTQYEITTANSMLAAINSFFKTMEWYDCVVKSFRVQREAFRSENRELSREEYYRLVQTAKENGNTRLYLLMQTVCSTGIRISELQFITVESLHIKRAKVSLKGKTRTVILPSSLCIKLMAYVEDMKIESGSIFVTRNGTPMNRSNIFKEMKALCEQAGVEKEKVFPHNLRHLFACVYYEEEKDISHLADLLGHASVNTTRIYLSKSGEQQAKQIEKMNLVI